MELQTSSPTEHGTGTDMCMRISNIMCMIIN